jgi:hypothetical protein
VRAGLKRPPGDGPGAAVLGLPHLQYGYDLAVFRKPPQFLLGEDQVAVDGHLKNASAPLDELRPDPDFLLHSVRQTGGARSVVSDQAELELDLHLLGPSPMPPTALPGVGPSRREPAPLIHLYFTRRSFADSLTPRVFIVAK